MTDIISDFEKRQHAELDSWFSEDPTIERDKRLREIARYPLLKKQMGLDSIDTSDMVVADIGCGPFGGVSTVLKTRETVRIDPLLDEYKKHYPIMGLSQKAEESDLSRYDLIIITNAMDHFENPLAFLNNLSLSMKPGAYLAHMHAENNAYTHKHEAHAHSINPELLHSFLDKDFETVWELTYAKDDLRYGWQPYNGKVGQPAFSGLFRKVTGYSK